MKPKWAKRHVRVGDLVRVGGHAPRHTQRFPCGLLVRVGMDTMTREYYAEVLLTEGTLVQILKRHLETIATRQ